MTKLQGKRKIERGKRKIRITRKNRRKKDIVKTNICIKKNPEKRKLINIRTNKQQIMKKVLRNWQATPPLKKKVKPPPALETLNLRTF